LLCIGLKAKAVPTDKLPASNLVFLIDVSGSMNEANKLPLVQSLLKMLTDQLRAKDKVAIVVYAGNAGLVLPPTPGNQKMAIKDAIDRLSAGGSTAGGQGIRLAYQVARENFLKGGNNRVILSTDGDFNVGASSDEDMKSLIEQERKSGVFLSVLGFGMGNYKDSKMETLADKGNGNYAYIDNITEARKTLVSEFGGTLFIIAKDVKLQLEFNPAKVQAYRLIGYENRLLSKEDFNNNLKDAGDMGVGHTVTAFPRA
jgi:Ca-activated chloride channel family protein